MKIFPLCLYLLWVLLQESSQQSSVSIEVDNVRSTELLPSATPSNALKMSAISSLPSISLLTSIVVNPTPLVSATPTLTAYPPPSSIEESQMSVPYQSSASVLPTAATQEAKETSIMTSSPLDITSSLTDMTSSGMISTESLTQSQPMSTKTLASGYISTSTKLPTETPTNSTSSDSGSFFEFVTDNPIAFGMVVSSAVFVTGMCCILGCVVIKRKLLSSKKRAQRRQSILDQTGDVCIVNQGTNIMFTNSPRPTHGETQPSRAVNALQTSPNDAFIIANPAAQSTTAPPLPPPRPQYYELQTRSQPHQNTAAISPTSPMTSSLSPMTSSSSVMMTPSSSQNIPLIPQWPSAPPKRHI